MTADIKTYTYPNGEIQRVQCLRLPSWEELEFFLPEPSADAFDCFCDIYRLYLVPACPWIFGSMVLFRLPEDMSFSFAMYHRRFGAFSDPLNAAAALFRDDLKIVMGKPRFKSREARELYEALEARGCLRIIRGRLPVTDIIPVGNFAGYMTRSEQSAPFKLNSSFFILDRFDCATVYDRVGAPLGLSVKNGLVLSPPLFEREALLVKKNGSISLSPVSLNELEIVIGEHRYKAGVNAELYCRPQHSRLREKGGIKLIITGNEVIAVNSGSSVAVPASGFVLLAENARGILPGDRVEYRGMEDIVFGIQVGNSLVRGGAVTDRFISPFYNIRRLEPVPFPPSLYPPDFEGARAARMALGADEDGKPMAVWAEGAPKLGYVPGEHSCGASLSEFGNICRELGMYNAINLDGGGSAQILLGNRRSLSLPDRHENDLSEAERPIPLGLIIR